MHISWKVRHAAREWSRKLVLFAFFVFCTALLSTWMQAHWFSGHRRAQSVEQLPTSVAEVSDRWEELLALMRADRRIRIIRLELPASLLKYGRKPAAALEARSGSAPFIAVPRAYQSSLDARDLPYLDPRAIPRDALAKRPLPVKVAALQQYFLLVPDTSGENAKRFVRLR